MLFDAKEPDNLPLHEPWYSKLSKFRRLLLISALRPDKTLELVSIIVFSSFQQFKINFF